MPKISIIIRTKNEERWIHHCLQMVFEQNFKDFEVILVDNRSHDHTIEIAKRFPIAQIINVDHFRPGFAINEGIRASSGQYIVCLSAHCVPKSKDWLSSLLANFDKDSLNIAGVYGRQLPVSFTSPLDKRDLLTVFGQDRRIQIKDYFFHNANSIFPRSVWNEIPFDEEVTNIEDRVWGKEVIKRGYQIVYDPEASVYHHHGLHHSNNIERAKGVVSIIEKVDGSYSNDLPESLKPENINIAAFLPVQIQIELGSRSADLLRKTIDDLTSSQYIKSIYVISSEFQFDKKNIKWIDRSKIKSVDDIGIDELIQKSLKIIEDRGDFPEAILYVNFEYLSRPIGFYNDLIIEAQYKGYETVFAGYKDFGHYWLKDENSEFKQTDSSMKTRIERDPVYRALYGLGTLTNTSIIRQGKIVGGKIGILPLDQLQNTFRLRDMNE